MTDIQVGSALQELRDRSVAIREIAARHHGKRIQVIGSVARGDNRPDSDIDFLVDFETGSSLFDVAHLELELEALLGRQVDVVSVGGLKPRDSDILDEAVNL